MNAPATLRATVIPGEHVRITTDDHTRPFWEAAQQRRLVVPRCTDCGHFRLPPTPFCPICQSRHVEWIDLAGEATVYSFAVVHGFPGMPELILVPAVVELPDAPGARLVSNVIDIDPIDVTIGMTLMVDFSPIADGWLLPVFRPSSTTESKV
jgi:uncharacterized OB-fold protein